MDISETGPQARIDGSRINVRFGIYLPGLRFADGFEVIVRVIHEADQFTPGIEPVNFFLNWDNGHPYDLWSVDVELAAEALPSHFGKAGRYLYRYQLRRYGKPVALWFADPFAKEAGAGTRSAFSVGIDDNFTWQDAAFRVADVNDLIVYELMVDEFQQTFDGVVARLDYLQSLGVNAIEFMPLTNIAEPFRWGYMPLSYFSPEDRYGGSAGLKRLVNACHQRGIAVIVDAVYSHAHPDFPYNRLYEAAGIANPMMGRFADDMFGPGTDFNKAFTRDFFDMVNRYWLDEFHIDGFRYDYVPGIYDGPLGVGYARIAYETYQYSRTIDRFDSGRGYSRLIQCAEHLQDPRGILQKTYSNSAWQNSLLDKAENMASRKYVDDDWAHLLDLSFLGYPEIYTNEANGDSFPVTAFQYIESHDHSRLITRFGRTDMRDAFGMRYGNRDDYWFKLQPYVIGLYTCQGVPMLWQGQEFAEDYAIPDGGYTRVLARRPLHWEHFYDQAGKGLIRLYRILGRLRRENRALRSRRSWYYNRESSPDTGLIAYRREVGQLQEVALVFLNFSDVDQVLVLPFPRAGQWREGIDSNEEIVVAAAGEFIEVRVPSNYGKVFVLA